MKNVTLTFSEVTPSHASMICDFVNHLISGSLDDFSTTATDSTPEQTSADTSKKDKPKKDKGKNKDKNKTKTDDTPTTSSDEMPTASQLTRSARLYAEKFGRDARKTVLNEFGATGITGKNGLDEKHYAQVKAIFDSPDEHNASITVSDPELEGFQDAEPSKKKDKAKKDKQKKPKGKSDKAKSDKQKKPKGKSGKQKKGKQKN